MSCYQCQEADYIKDSRGCETPLETATNWLGDGDEYYNCPLRFIMPSVGDLLDKLDSFKNGYAMPQEYEKQSAKFLQAVKVYDRYMVKFSALKRGE